MLKRFLLLTFSCSVFMLFAQTYSLDYLVNEGLKNSRNILSQELQYKNSASTVSSSKADLYLPVATYNYSYTWDTPFAYNSNLSISKSISLNEPTIYSLRQSNLSHEAGKLELKAAQQNFAFTVFSAYLDLIQTQKNLDILNENLILQKRTYDQVFIQYQNNKKTIYDLQSSQIDTLSAYTDLLELQTQYQKQREDLFNQINVVDQNYPLEDIALSINEEAPIQDSYELKISSLNQKKEEISLTQTKYNLYPNLTLSYSLGFFKQSNNSTDFIKIGEYNANKTFLLNFSYPLFGWYEDGLSYRMKKRSKHITDLAHEDLVQTHKSKYTQALNDLKNNKITYDINKQKLDLAKTNLQIAEQRFNLGIINLLDLDKSRIQYLNAQLTLNSKYYSLLKKQEEVNLITSNKILNKW